MGSVASGVPYQCCPLLISRWRKRLAKEKKIHQENHRHSRFFGNEKAVSAEPVSRNYRPPFKRFCSRNGVLLNFCDAIWGLYALCND